MQKIEGSGEPVVFVHGNGSTHETWGPTIAPMTGHFRCISYDLRGHSASAPPLGEAHLDIFVDDLERVRTDLKLDRIRLVGHSLGAFIAAAYAVRFPERVTALALLAAPADRSDADRAAGAALITRLRAEGVAPVMASLVQSWYRPEFIAREPEALQVRLRQIASIADDVFIRTYALYTETEIAPLLPQITAPALVMTGELARGCGAEVARRVAEKLSRASLVVFDTLRNGILTEIPDKVAEELMRFFAAQ
ncbi:MAG: alpha/beta hydrolase [Hyphomicrobiaceae bacterium]